MNWARAYGSAALNLMTSGVSGSGQDVSSDGGGKKRARGPLDFKDKRYKYLNDLGSGGMSRVIRARDLTLKRDVAIKVMLTQAQYTPDSFRRFQREAQTAGQLKHPGIVNVLDFGLTADNEPFLVMEMLEGKSLAAYLRNKGGRLSIVESLALMIDVCSALEHAHSHGVLHRDIKPANIIVLKTPVDRMKVKLIDFGLAKFGEAEQELTKTGVALGSPPYMSPEQCEGKKEVDARSEVYSTGCVLFELLTGKRAFRAENALETISLHLKGEHPTLGESCPDEDFGEALEEIIAACLAVEPGERYQTVTELQEELESEYGRRQQLQTNVESESNSNKDYRAIAWLVALFVLLCGGASMFLFFDFSAPKDYSVSYIDKLEKDTASKRRYDKEITEQQDPFHFSNRYGAGIKVMEAYSWSEINEEKLKKYEGRKDYQWLRIEKRGFNGHGLRYLAGNPNLTDVDVFGNIFDEQGWRELAMLKNVRNLYVSFDKDFGDMDISPIQTLTKLEFMRVVCHTILPAETRQLALIPNMRVLHFTRVQDFKPGSFAALEKAVKLQDVSFRDSVLKPGMLLELKKVPHLRSITADGVTMPVEELAQLPISELTLRDMSVDFSKLKQLATSKTLRGLQLVRCAGVDQIGAVTLVHKFDHKVKLIYER